MSFFALQVHAARCPEHVGDQATPSAEAGEDAAYGGRWTGDPWLEGINPQFDSPATWAPSVFRELKAVLLRFHTVFRPGAARTHQQQLAEIQNFRQQYPSVRRLLIDTCDRFVQAARQAEEAGQSDRSLFLNKLQKTVKNLFPSLGVIDQETPMHLVSSRSEVGLKTLERIVETSDPSDEIRSQRLVVQNLERYSKRLSNLLLGMHSRGFLYDSVLPRDLDVILGSLFRPEPGYEPRKAARKEIIDGLGRSEIRAVSVRDGREVELVFLRAWNRDRPDQIDTLLAGLQKLARTMEAIQKLGAGIRFEAVVYLRVFSGEPPHDVENRLRKTVGDYITLRAL